MSMGTTHTPAHFLPDAAVATYLSPMSESNGEATVCATVTTTTATFPGADGRAGGDCGFGV